MIVLDASAILCVVLDEPGAELVASTLKSLGNPQISSVNLSEVAKRLASQSVSPKTVSDEICSNLSLTIQNFTREDAVTAADLVPLTSQFGLSLADRACLALSKRIKPTFVLKTDRVWERLRSSEGFSNIYVVR